MNGQNDEIFMTNTTPGHNKYYDMYNNQDGTFTAHWGKILTYGQSKIYPIDVWYTKYYEKLDKGYQEVSYSMGRYDRADDLH